MPFEFVVYVVYVVLGLLGLVVVNTKNDAPCWTLCTYVPRSSMEHFLVVKFLLPELDVPPTRTWGERTKSVLANIPNEGG